MCKLETPSHHFQRVCKKVEGESPYGRFSSVHGPAEAPEQFWGSYPSTVSKLPPVDMQSKQEDVLALLAVWAAC
jgi:hypothetical protein